VYFVQLSDLGVYGKYISTVRRSCPVSLYFIVRRFIQVKGTKYRSRVNQNEYNPDDLDIFSAASWPTNAITPILKAVEDTLGVVKDT
jgi:hypothetical protein